MPNDTLRLAVDEIVQAVVASWQEDDFRPEALPRAARRAFEAVDLHRRLDPESTLSGTLDAAFDLPLPEQEHSLALHMDERLEVLAHFRPDELTGPRRHDWWGAVQQVAGSSLHGRFQFVADEAPVDSGGSVQTGEVSLRSATFLEPGAIVEVDPEPASFHAVWPAEGQTLLISIRARNRQGLAMDLVRPALAITEVDPPSAVARRLRIRDLLDPLDEERRQEMLRSLCCDDDLASVYHALRRAWEQDEDVPEEILEEGARRHGAPFDAVLRSLEDLERAQQIRAARAGHRDPDLHYVLAALFLADDRDHVAALLDARFGVPESEEARSRRLGSFLGELLVEGDELPEGLASALGRLADGFTLEDAARALDVEPDEEEDLLDFLEQVGEAMVSSAVYRPLFS